MVQEFKNKMYIIQIVLETIKQGHAPRATLQLNVKYVCFKRRAGGITLRLYKASRGGNYTAFV